jgi:hypothetical protein
MHVELLHNSAAMGIHRVDAQVQHRSDFLVGLAFRDHLQHFAFAAGQQIDGIGHVAPVIVEYRVGYPGAQVAFAARDGAHGGQQVARDGVFQQVAVGYRPSSALGSGEWPC